MRDAYQRQKTKLGTGSSADLKDTKSDRLAFLEIATTVRHV